MKKEAKPAEVILGGFFIGILLHKSVLPEWIHLEKSSSVGNIFCKILMNFIVLILGRPIANSLKGFE